MAGESTCAPPDLAALKYCCNAVNGTLIKNGAACKDAGAIPFDNCYFKQINVTRPVAWVSNCTVTSDAAPALSVPGAKSVTVYLAVALVFISAVLSNGV